MIRAWLVLIVLVGLIVWGILVLIKRRKQIVPSAPRFTAKLSSVEMWTQLFETDSLDEARSIRARLTEEELSCLLYEQAKKDSYGNVPKSFGLVVPKVHLSRAQTVLARILS